MQILVEAADVDGDGKVSLEDFRGMLDFTGAPDAEHTAPLGAASAEAADGASVAAGDGEAGERDGAASPASTETAAVSTSVAAASN